MFRIKVVQVQGGGSSHIQFHTRGNGQRPDGEGRKVRVDVDFVGDRYDIGRRWGGDCSRR